MQTRKKALQGASFALGVGALALLSGCTSILSDLNPIESSYDKNKPLESTPEGVMKSRSKGDEGIEFLRKGQYQQAIGCFSKAIRLNPQNGYLHYLNALAHTFLGHTKPAAYSNAQVGFQVALRLDPGNSWAAYNFGQLYLMLGEYSKAQDQFANALLSSPKNTQFLMAFTVTSYLVQDVVSALQGVKELETLGVQSAEFYRTAALVYAASNEPKKALENLRSFEKSRPRPELTSYLKERVASWEQFFRLIPREDLEALIAQPKGALAKAALPGISSTLKGKSKAHKEKTSKKNVSHKKSTKHQEVKSSDLEGTSSQEESNRTSADDVLHMNLTEVDVASENETPVELHNQMVVLDVLIIRTEMIRDASLGQNIMSSLGPVEGFGGNPLWGYTYGTAGAFSNASNGVVTSPNSVVTQSLGLSSVSYSLDIANNAHTHSDIVATPSLVATHGKQSKFFSGTAVTLALTSTQGGGNLVTHEVGVNLKVTPTFLEDGRISLDVSAERSEFSNSALPGNVEVSSITTPVMQTVTSSMTATGVLGKGESMIVSGLKENVKVNTRSGTPGLEDVPVASFFFSHEAVQQLDRTVIFIISPRFNEKVVKDANGQWIVLPTEEVDKSQHYLTLLKHDFSHIFSSAYEKPLLKGLLQPQFSRHFRPKDMPIHEEEAINLPSTLDAIRDYV